MDKKASIVVPGAGEDDPLNIFEIAVGPDATVDEILVVLGLEGFELRNGSGHRLAESDNLHKRIQDGATLYATVKMDVG